MKVGNPALYNYLVNTGLPDPNDNNNKWVEHLATKKYFSFLIDEKYGGIKLSTNELSNILTKSCNRFFSTDFVKSV